MQDSGNRGTAIFIASTGTALVVSSIALWIIMQPVLWVGYDQVHLWEHSDWIRSAGGIPTQGVHVSGIGANGPLLPWLLGPFLATGQSEAVPMVLALTLYLAGFLFLARRGAHPIILAVAILDPVLILHAAMANDNSYAFLPVTVLLLASLAPRQYLATRPAVSSGIAVGALAAVTMQVHFGQLPWVMAFAVIAVVRAGKRANGSTGIQRAVAATVVVCLAFMPMLSNVLDGAAANRAMFDWSDPVSKAWSALTGLAHLSGAWFANAGAPVVGQLSTTAFAAAVIAVLGIRLYQRTLFQSPLFWGTMCWLAVFAARSDYLAAGHMLTARLTVFVELAWLIRNQVGRRRTLTDSLAIAAVALLITGYWISATQPRAFNNIVLQYPANKMAAPNPGLWLDMHSMVAQEHRFLPSLVARQWLKNTPLPIDRDGRVDLDRIVGTATPLLREGGLRFLRPGATLGQQSAVLISWQSTDRIDAALDIRRVDTSGLVSGSRFYAWPASTTHGCDAVSATYPCHVGIQVWRPNPAIESAYRAVYVPPAIRRMQSAVECTSPEVWSGNWTILEWCNGKLAGPVTTSNAATQVRQGMPAHVSYWSER